MNSFIGTKKAAARLGISVRRVQALIAAGRLPAEKIGNSFAIRESDLKLLDGRKNGRPKPACKRTSEEWDQILKKLLGPATRDLRPASTKRKNEKIKFSKKILEKPPEERTQEEWDAIIDKYAGSVSLGPPDLSTNKKYMEGFGRDKVFRR